MWLKLVQTENICSSGCHARGTKHVYPCCQSLGPTALDFNNSPTYSGFSNKRDALEVHSRRDGALLAQLRTDHCINLASYRYRIGKSQDDNCPHCNLEAESVDHWIRKCPKHDALRLSIFGTRTPGLEVLGSQPGNVLRLARATLL